MSSDRWRRARRSATSASLSVNLARIASTALAARSEFSDRVVKAKISTASVIGG